MAIGVLPVADIAGDAVTTAEDTAVTINVLSNDTFEGSSPAIVAVNGQAIGAGGAAVAVANGSVALNALGQLVFTPAANYNGPANFSYTVSSGGVSETANVAVNVTPVADVANVSLSATPSVAEGGAIVYTATLDTPALTPVTVSLSNGGSITIAAGATSGTVALAAPGDDVYVDADHAVGHDRQRERRRLRRVERRCHAGHHRDHRHGRQHHGVADRVAVGRRRRPDHLHRVAERAGAERRHRHAEQRRHDHDRSRRQRRPGQRGRAER